MGAACGKSEKESATPASGVTPGASATSTSNETPKYGGTSVGALDTEVLTLDPHMTTVVYTIFEIGPASNGILMYDQNAEIAGDLAESWKYNTDTELIINLRKGVKWHNIAPVNGREFVADDVVYNLKRIGTNDPRFARRARMEPVVDVVAVDKYTVKITLKRPDAYFLDFLANPFTLMVAKEYVESMPDGELTKGCIGTGPFILKEHNKGVGAKLERNPDYFRTDQYGNKLPYLDGLEIMVVPDPTARKVAFKTDKIPSYLATAGEVDEMKAAVPNALVAKTLYGGARYTAFHVTHKPFDDLRVRQAIMYATDIDEYIRVVAQGAGEPMVGAVPPTQGKWALPKEELFTYDLEKAKQLLAEAGLPNGFKTSTEATTVGQYDIQAQVLQSQLKKVGIDLSVKMVPFGEWVSKAYKGQYDIYTCLDEVGVTPDDFVYPRFHTGGKKNTIEYSNPKVDELLDKQRLTIDDEERLKIVYEVQRLINADLPQVNLMQGYFFSLTQPYVHGSHPELFGRIGSTSHLTQFIWYDK